MSRNKDKIIDKSKTAWRKALEEAESQIITYKRKIYELNSAIRIMKEKISAGEPWPGQLDVHKSK